MGDHRGVSRRASRGARDGKGGDGWGAGMGVKGTYLRWMYVRGTGGDTVML
jgi:hypothetical protein